MSQKYNSFMIASVKNYIKENMKTIDSLELLAVRLNINFYTLRNLFEWQTGTSLSEFLLCCRIEAAKYLLRTTGIKISAIAREVGFKNESTFFKAFKRCVKMTPGMYRESVKIDSENLQFNFPVQNSSR